MSEGKDWLGKASIVMVVLYVVLFPIWYPYGKVRDLIDRRRARRQAAR